MQQLDLTQVLEEVLSGKQHIISHPGTGQYQATESASVGTSACGLAALNCARVVFQYEDSRDSSKSRHPDCGQSEHEMHDEGRCLLYRTLSHRAAEEIIAICSAWTTGAHLDVEDILDLPIFKHAFDLVRSSYGQAKHADFSILIQEMSEIGGDRAIASVITRPPEIVLCLKVSGVFIVFDSHPRPSHPSGSGFVLNSSAEATAAYLDRLLSIDSGILSDPSLRWQAELLGHFSSHILLPKSRICDYPEIDAILMDASIKVLRLMVELAELKRQELSFVADNEYLSSRVTQLEQTLAAVDVRGKKGKGRALQLDAERRTTSASTSASTPSSASTGTRSAFHPRNPGHPLSKSQGGSNVETNEEIAVNLQAQFDQEDQRLANERKRLLHLNRTFKCRVCFDTLQEDYIAKISGCGHFFCRDCLRRHVKATVGDRRYPITCPACVADNVKRPTNVGRDVLLTLGISDSTYEIFEEMQLAVLSVILHCRKCKESMFVDKAEYQSTKLIVCPLRGCNHVWCKLCEQSIQVPGPQHSCDGSSEMEHLMKMRGWRYCPGCQTPFQKESGCNHMTCLSPGCNMHFCYVCGDKITQSLVRSEIRSAISAHYRKCTLFQDV